jgi:hypothetical protein
MLTAATLTGCDRGSRPAAGSATAAPGSATPSGPASTAPAATAGALQRPSASPSASSSASPSGSASAAAGVAGADRAAGVTSTRFSTSGSGKLVVVKGSAPAPGRGTVVKIRVEVEAGLPIDPQDFAGFVMDTLNDPRSWGHGGRMTFARTDGAAGIRVVLASPDTSARMCLPLKTFGRLSCHSGDAAVLTEYRWVKAIPEYGSDRTGYRHYVVNHEVGHALGHGHQQCAGRGQVAPVMMQQTKGLKGCLPNSWPFP